MTKRKYPACRIAVLTCTLLAGSGVHAAGILDSVGGTLGKSDAEKSLATDAGSALTGLAGNSVPALDSVGTGNLAGVLQYCVKNKFLGSDAVSVGSQLTELAGGKQKLEADPGYKEGLSGVLGGDSDTNIDLSSAGIKQQLTDKLCDKVLDYSKSLL